MKKIALIAALGLLGMGSAMAQSAAGTFNVVINLTGKCEINSTNTATGAVISDLTMNYTSFQTTPATGSTNFNVRCTNNLPYSIALNTTGDTDNAVQLLYQLNLSSSSTHSAGNNGTLASLTGTGSNQPYYVHGTIGVNQAGNCATFTAGGCNNSTATNRGRTVTVSY
jgi:spore coat protein U-like protein